MRSSSGELCQAVADHRGNGQTQGQSAENLGQGDAGVQQPGAVGHQRQKRAHTRPGLGRMKAG